MDCECARFAVMSAPKETDEAVAKGGSGGSQSVETATPSSNCSGQGSCEFSRDISSVSVNTDIGKDSGCGPAAARAAERPLRGRAVAGGLRRRRYVLPGDAKRMLPSKDSDCLGRRLAPSGAAAARACRPLAPTQEGCPELASRGARAAGTAGALVEGPMQQRSMLFLWRWRWCVLTRQELRVYADHDASVVHPDCPLERYSAGALDVAQDLHSPSTLVCMEAISGEPLLLLRPGPEVHFEELVALRLWQHGFSAARMLCQGGPRGPAELPARPSTAPQ